MDFNKIILKGRVGKDPEVKNLKFGDIVELSVATSDSWKDKETGEKLVKFYGMASNNALQKFYSDKIKIDYKASEGKLVNIPYKGPLEDTLLDLLGGVRSTCTYIGAKKIKDISKCTTFVCVNNQLNN